MCRESDRVGEGAASDSRHEAFGVDTFLHESIDQFDALYADSRRHSRVMGIPLHPMLIGQPLRIKYLQQAIAYMKKHERVWFATAGEIVDAYEQANPVS